MERTFTMIKPTAVKNCDFPEILGIITNNGFKVIGLKMVQFTTKRAEMFYGIHRNKAFFSDLIKFMIAGPVIVAVLEKDNAVSDFRNLIGHTNPTKAEKGTIRKLFGSCLSDNAIHGSDSNDSAEIEIRFHFSESELF